MTLQAQDYYTLEDIVRADQRDGPLMYPVLVNVLSADRLELAGLIVRHDAGIFRVPRPTPEGKRVLRDAKRNGWRPRHGE